MDPLLASDLELARQISPAEKLAQALEMMTAGIRLKRVSLRHRFPAASNAEIEKMMADWLLQDG
jgi:Rv0078B-related antitoxin